MAIILNIIDRRDDWRMCRLTLSAEVSINPTSSKVTSDRTAITSLNRGSLERKKKKLYPNVLKNEGHEIGQGK